MIELARVERLVALVRADVVAVDASLDQVAAEVHLKSPVAGRGGRRDAQPLTVGVAQDFERAAVRSALDEGRDEVDRGHLADRLDPRVHALAELGQPPAANRGRIAWASMMFTGAPTARATSTRLSGSDASSMALAARPSVIRSAMAGCRSVPARFITMNAGDVGTPARSPQYSGCSEIGAREPDGQTGERGKSCASHFCNVAGRPCIR